MKAINGYEIKPSANLSYANLRSADLSSANLRYANLRYANLRSANLRSANLSYANLSYANLRSADLSSANLRYANYQISTLLHNVNWGILPDDVTIELMNRDAIICGKDKMEKWRKGGICPFSDKIQRDFFFKENTEIYKRISKPKLNDLELFKALCKAKKIKISI